MFRDLIDVAYTSRRLYHHFGVAMREKLCSHRLDVRIRTGQLVDEKEFTAPERFLASEFLIKPENAMFWQRLRLMQGQGSRSDDQGSRWPGTLGWRTYRDYALRIGWERDSLVQTWVSQYGSYMVPLEKLRYSVDDRRVGLIRFQLLLLRNIRRLDITTTYRGDDGFILGLLDGFLNPNEHFISDEDYLGSKEQRFQRALKHLFKNTNVATMISQQQIDCVCTFTCRFPFRELWAMRNRQILEELELLQRILSMPAIGHMRVYGMVNLMNTPSDFWSDNFVRRMTFKRCLISAHTIVKIIDQSTNLEAFTYDHCSPERIWRIQSRAKTTTGASIHGPSWKAGWNPAAIIRALQSKASKTLKILDLSSEVAWISPSTHKYEISSLQAFERVQFVGIHATSLPTRIVPRSSKDDERTMTKQVDLVKFLPPTVRKLHICGPLTRKQAKELFQEHCTAVKLESQLTHVSSEERINLSDSFRRNLECFKRLFFEIVHRTSKERHLTHENNEEALEALFKYPDARTVKRWEGGRIVVEVMD